MAKKPASQTEQTAAPVKSGPFTFEHEGHEIAFYRGTVRSAIEARRLVQHLLRAYGHVEGNPASDEDYANFNEYASAMARTQTSASWWAHSSMTPDEIRQKYEAFFDLDEDLYASFRAAAAAYEALKLARAVGG